MREARRSEREGLDPQTDAVAVVAERVRHWEALAEDQGRAYAMDLATTGPLLRASRADLEALVDVLLDNVFSHTADDAAVRITLTATDDHLELVVEDAGPGLPPGLEVTGRGESGAGSTGLGLSIASPHGQRGLRRRGHDGHLGHGWSPGRRHVADGLTQAAGGAECVSASRSSRSRSCRRRE